MNRFDGTDYQGIMNAVERATTKWEEEFKPHPGVTKAEVLAFYAQNKREAMASDAARAR